MPTLTNEKLIKYLAIAVTVVACLTRLSVAVASIANGLALLLVLYLWHRNQHSFNLSDEAKGYVKAYLVFILLMFPSVFVSDKPLVSLKELLNFLVWRYGKVIFIAIMAFIKRRDYLVNMLTALLLTTTADCLLAVPQSLLNMGHGGRGWGLGGNSLYLSGILCMVLPAALVVAMDPAFEKRLKKAASCATAAIPAGLIFNNSRSAWLTEVLVIPPAIWKYVKQQKKFLLGFVMVLACIAAFMAAKKKAQQAKAVAKKQPKAALKKPPTLDMPNLPHSHNNFLQVAAETGLIGLAVFLYFCGYVLVTSFKHYRNAHNPCDKLIFVVFLSNIIIMGRLTLP